MKEASSPKRLAVDAGLPLTTVQILSLVEEYAFAQGLEDGSRLYASRSYKGDRRSPRLPW